MPFCTNLGRIGIVSAPIATLCGMVCPKTVIWVGMYCATIELYVTRKLLVDSSWLAQFKQQHRLPSTFDRAVEHFYWPLVQHVAALVKQRNTPLLLGIHGCQGSGKSTLTAFLCDALTVFFKINAVGMSLDDFYYTRAERQRLARQVHPLLMTRGVPGTHDTDFLQEVLSDLMAQHTPVVIPRFDKAMDDRCSPQAWNIVNQPVRVIILEGWCVAVEPQPLSALKQPINAFEAKYDPDGQWRHYVNQQLAQRYQPIFQQLDRLLMLRAPSFDAVLHWRIEQEDKLRESLRTQASTQHTPIQLMTHQQIAHFIAHYQRLTEHALQTLPQQADDVLMLSPERCIQHWHRRGVA